MLRLQQPVAKAVCCLCRLWVLFEKSDEPGIRQKHEPTSGASLFCKYIQSQHKSDLVICRERLHFEAYNWALLGQECIKEIQQHNIWKAQEKQIQFWKRRLVVIIVRHILQKQNYKVTDHCQRTGEYRGATHNMCNINFFSYRYLPVSSTIWKAATDI